MQNNRNVIFVFRFYCDLSKHPGSACEAFANVDQSAKCEKGKGGGRVAVLASRLMLRSNGSGSVLENL